MSFRRPPILSRTHRHTHTYIRHLIRSMRFSLYRQTIAIVVAAAVTFALKRNTWNDQRYNPYMNAYNILECTRFALHKEKKKTYIGIYVSIYQEVDERRRFKCREKKSERKEWSAFTPGMCKESKLKLCTHRGGEWVLISMWTFKHHLNFCASIWSQVADKRHRLVNRNVFTHIGGTVLPLFSIGRYHESCVDEFIRFFFLLKAFA